MGWISENAEDLVARVTSVPALATSAGLALGGRGADPALTKIPLPAAWIMFGKDQVDESPYGTSQSGMRGGLTPNGENVQQVFSVVIYVPYVSQDDLLTVQFPLLESVIAAVRGDGKPAPSGNRWRYTGQKLAMVYPDRLAYEQHYTLDAFM
ncbi:MAG: hypothetical protein ACXU85_00990 [Xanthobacteraceae bacterium]